MTTIRFARTEQGPQIVTAIGIAAFALLGLRIATFDPGNGQTRESMAERDVVAPARPLPAPDGRASASPGPVRPHPFAPSYDRVARSDVDRERAAQCLTSAIYYEARSESLGGQAAVAQVVLNRLRSGRFAHSVCGVVYQGRESGRCQFSFACDGSTGRVIDRAAWTRAARVAAGALAGHEYAAVGNATFYHSMAVRPWWSRVFDEVAAVGAHVFYGWSGPAGARTAYARAGLVAEPDAAQPAVRPRTTAAPMTTVTFANAAAVTIHRGIAPVPRQRTVVAHEGVRVHYGTRAPAVTTTVAGVTIHIG